MEIGQKNTVSVKVTENNIAINVGSGDVEVFATPMMIALMEKAASECIAAELPEGMTSVGGFISTSHTSATPIGCTAFATAEIVEFTEKKVEFKVTACDDSGIIGEGTHTRFIVNKEKFHSRAMSKLQNK
ncbi:MAG: thioesterase family protein [Oscillospiraceae bacterium]